MQSSQTISEFGRRCRLTGLDGLLKMVLLTAAIVLFSPASSMAERTATIGVWAVEGPEAALAECTPTARFLSEQIPDCSFRIVPLPREMLADQVRRNQLDFVITDPALSLQLEADADIEPVATRQTLYRGVNYTHCGGVLFCRADRHDLRRPEDLKGRRLAAVDQFALHDWLAVEREFLSLDITPLAEPAGVLFLGSTEAVIGAVLDGRADAGCVRASALEAELAARKLDRSSVRVLVFRNIRNLGPRVRIPVAVSTRLYPDWGFAACPRAPADLVQLVSSVLPLMANRQPEVVDRPNRNGWTVPRSRYEVHTCLQDLRLRPYERFGEVSLAAVVRKYMYAFIGFGILLVVLTLAVLYVTALNRALIAEIGERKRAEVALRDSVQRFEHIASCSADWIWEADAEGRFTYSSAIVEQMLGYRPDEVLGRRQFDLFAAAEKERVKGPAPSTVGQGARVFRERYRFLTKDGRVVIHETTAEPVLDGEGKLVGYRGVNRDVTQQVRFVRLRP